MSKDEEERPRAPAPAVSSLGAKLERLVTHPRFVDIGRSTNSSVWQPPVWKVVLEPGRFVLRESLEAAVDEALERVDKEEPGRYG